MNNTEGPVILNEEVGKAINCLRPDKAPGDDEISIEMLQDLDALCIDKLKNYVVRHTIVDIFQRT